jgi:hypothetical protein
MAVGASAKDDTADDKCGEKYGEENGNVGF